MKEKFVIIEIKEEDLHDKDTRAIAVKKTLLGKQIAIKKLKGIETIGAKMKSGKIEIDKEKHDTLEAELNGSIGALGSKAKILICEENSRYLLRDITQLDLTISQNPIMEVLNNILFIGLR